MEKGKCLLLPFSCLYTLLGEQEKEENEKPLQNPLLDTDYSTGLIDHISSSWSLTHLKRMRVHVKFAGFEPQLLVKFPSCQQGEQQGSLMGE